MFNDSPKAIVLRWTRTGVLLWTSLAGGGGSQLQVRATLRFERGLGLLALERFGAQFCAQTMQEEFVLNQRREFRQQLSLRRGKFARLAIDGAQCGPVGSPSGVRRGAPA